MREGVPRCNPEAQVEDPPRAGVVREASASARLIQRRAGEIGLRVLDELEDVFVFVKDTERRFVLCNAAFPLLMGFRDARDLLGRRDEELSPEYLVEHYRRTDLEVLRKGTQVSDLLELVHDSERGYAWFTTTKFPIVDDHEIIGLAGITRPVAQHAASEHRVSSLMPVIELISREYHRTLAVDELAAAASMSASYFNKAFRRHFGVTPHRYLRMVRLMVACELLSTTDLAVGTIAARTGYYDQSHLANEFLRERGITPGSYRRKYRKQGRAGGRVRIRLVVEPMDAQEGKQNTERLPIDGPLLSKPSDVEPVDLADSEEAERRGRHAEQRRG